MKTSFEAAMEFHILGPLTVVRAGQVLDLGRAKQRALLAVLLISANRVVAFDRLVELLWQGEPPAHAGTALHASVSNLRRALEPDRAARAPAEVLVTRSPGYVLQVEPERVDAFRFERLAVQAHEILVAGRPRAARHALDEALSLWDGPALADFATERFALAEAARLEDLRAVAIEDRLQATLDLGDHDHAVAALEAAVQADPLRERLWGLLILALYRSGRQAEALRAYGRARRLLADELGVEPHPSLRALESQVLAQSPALNWTAPETEDVGAPTRSPGPAFVGRAAEIESLAAAAAGTRRGNGGLVLLSGEPGIGKTRLAEELVAQATGQGMGAAWGEGCETEGAPPFWPWVQVIRAVLAQVGAAVDLATLAGAGDLAQLLPERDDLAHRAHPGPVVDPAAARFRLYEAVVELLLAAAELRPLVVVLDDLHWADPPSLQLLAHVAGRVEATRVLLVATYRDREAELGGAVGDVLGPLARRRGVRRLRLRGLSRSEVARFVAEAGGIEPTPEQVEVVHARTEGNPFFMGELSQLLASEGAAGVAATAVPEGVRDVVRRRLAPLPEGTKSLLIVASTVGRDFDLRLVASVAQTTLDRAIDQVDPAVAIGLVTDERGTPGRYRFSHALVRDTIRAQLGGLRGAQLHARVGEAIEGLPDADARVAELAHHFYRGAVVAGPEKGIDYALLAGEKARQSLAYEQAEEHLGRALELVTAMAPGRDRARTEMRIQNRLAAVLTVTEGFTGTAATRSWDRASSLAGEAEDGGADVASSWGVMSLSCVQADMAATSRIARELLRAGSTSDDGAALMTGHFGLGRAALFAGDLAEALDRFTEACALCDGLDERARLDVFGWLDPAVLCRVNAALVLGLLDRPSEAEHWAAEGRVAAGRADHPLSVGAALMFGALVAVLAGDPLAARHRADALTALATEHGLPDFIAAASIFGGWAAARHHEAEGGLARIRAGITSKRAAGFRMWQTVNFGLLADACRDAGRPDDALVAVDEGLAEAEATGERFYAAELLRLRGELLVDTGGDPEEARAYAVDAVALARMQGAALLRRRAERGLADMARPAVTVP